MKKIITLIAIVTTMFVACQKKSSAPASTATTSSVSTGTVYCMSGYPPASTSTTAVFLECFTGTSADAHNRQMWYRDNGYTGVISVQKSSCSQCQ